MRVLLLTPQLSTGGQERQVSLLAPALAAGGHDVAVATWNHDDTAPFAVALDRQGIAVEPLDGSGSAAKVRSLRGLVRSRRPDVVHSYGFYTNVVAALGAMASGAVAIGSIRSDLEASVRRSGPVLGRLSARHPRTIVANSAAAADAARRTTGPWSPRDVRFIPNGVAADGFDPDPAAMDDDPPVVLGVGALDHRKRWDRAVAVAARLRDRGCRFRLLVAGDGPDRAALERQVAAADLGDHVQLLGQVADVAALYRRARVLLLTSDVEGTPNVVIEAFAAGRPVVGRAVGDVARLVDGAGAGATFGDDEDAAATAVARYLIDRDAAVADGAAGRRHVVEELSVARLADRTATLYAEVAGR